MSPQWIPREIGAGSQVAMSSFHSPLLLAFVLVRQHRRYVSQGQTLLPGRLKLLSTRFSPRSIRVRPPAFDADFRGI